jgi:hypothetical protein
MSIASLTHGVRPQFRANLLKSMFICVHLPRYLVPQPLKVDMFATIFLNRRKRRMPNGGIEELPFGQKHLAIFAIKAGASARSSSVPSVTSCSKNDDWHASLLLVPASPGWDYGCSRNGIGGFVDPAPSPKAVKRGRFTAVQSQHREARGLQSETSPKPWVSHRT